MPACPACRAVVAVGARRCPACRARLGWPPDVELLPEEPADPVRAPAETSAPEAGPPVDSGVRPEASRGGVGPPAPTSPPATPPASSRTSPPWRLLAGALAAIVALVGAGVVVTQRGADATSELEAYLDGSEAVRYQDPQGRFELRLPAEPTRTQEGGIDRAGPWVVDVLEATSGGVTMVLRTFEASEGPYSPEDRERLLRENVRASAGEALVVAERTGEQPVTLDYVIGATDGPVLGRASMSGRQVFQIEVHGEDGGDVVAAFRRVADSLRPGP